MWAHTLLTHCGEVRARYWYLGKVCSSGRIVNKIGAFVINRDQYQCKADTGWREKDEAQALIAYAHVISIQLRKQQMT